MKTRLDELTAAFETYDAKHPEVWRMFCLFTLDRIRVGCTYYGAKSIIERIRWETDAARIQSKENEFKVNNNYAPFYARRFHAQYPKWNGFFRLRHQTSQETLPAKRNQLGPRTYDWEGVYELPQR